VRLFKRRALGISIEREHKRMLDNDTLNTTRPPATTAQPIAVAPVQPGIPAGPFLLWTARDKYEESWHVGRWTGEAWTVDDDPVSPGSWSPIALPELVHDAAVELWTQPTTSARPIASAPIGGPDYFPPRTPGRQPLNHVFLWQPPYGGCPGCWCLGYWGGPRQALWCDSDMSALDPQPTHWAPMLPPPA
jgi:hypothetical protein